MADLQIFVVGMNGSGTTMLADSLGRHSEIYMFPFESKIIPLYLARERKVEGMGDLVSWRAMADEIGRTLAFWRANGGQPLCVPDEVIAGVSDTGGLFHSVFRYLAERAGKRGWVEKSPGNIEHLLALARAFPSAKFIHIIRDGRDAAQSFHRRWWFDPLHTIWRWKHCVRMGRQAGAVLGPDRYMEIKYEELTSNPDRCMRVVCDFVGVAFDAAVLSSSMQHMDIGSRPAASTIVPNSGRWAVYFDIRTARKLESIAGAALAELGYGVQHEGDEEFSPARQRWLRIKDAVLRSLAFFRDRGVQGLPMYLRRIRGAALTRSVRRF